MPAVTELNYAVILTAALAAFLLGALWYSPIGFGNTCITAAGRRREELGSPHRATAAMFVSTLITALVLAVIMSAAGARSPTTGALFGLMLGGGVVATGMLSDYVFCGWPVRVYAIQAGYRVVTMLIMGAILGAAP